MVILAPRFTLKDCVIHPVGMMEGRYEGTLNLAVMPLDRIMPALRLDSVPFNSPDIGQPPKKGTAAQLSTFDRGCAPHRRNRAAACPGGPQYTAK